MVRVPFAVFVVLLMLSFISDTLLRPTVSRDKMTTGRGVDFVEIGFEPKTEDRWVFPFAMHQFFWILQVFQDSHRIIPFLGDITPLERKNANVRTSSKRQSAMPVVLESGDTFAPTLLEVS